MPPRNPELPEGTDQIVNGASAEEGGGKSVGFVASGGNGGSRTDKLVSQVRDQVDEPARPGRRQAARPRRRRQGAGRPACSTISPG